MSKTLQTVYVPTGKQTSTIVVNSIHRGRTVVEYTQAYLYTEQEHQSAQGYRDALNIIASCKRKVGYDFLSDYFAEIAQQALSAAPTTQETNVLEELEKWVKEQEKNQRHFTIIRTDDLLTKIQSLKPQP